jgi:hypothetical protein
LQVTATSVATLVAVSWGVADSRTGVALGDGGIVGEGVPVAGMATVGVISKERPIPVQPANRMMIDRIVINKYLLVILCLQTNKFYPNLSTLSAFSSGSPRDSSNSTMPVTNSGAAE